MSLAIEEKRLKEVGEARESEFMEEDMREEERREEERRREETRREEDMRREEREGYMGESKSGSRSDTESKVSEPAPTAKVWIRY